MWATDLNISYSDMVSMSNLLAYMSYGKFDPTTHSFDVALHHTDPQTKKKKNKKSATEPNVIIFFFNFSLVDKNWK